ncbi:MAG TPA: DNA/RNA helicase domain-containing protein, partial [Pseudomonadales bacterium]
MEEHASYNGVGWQSDLTTFHSTAPNVIRSKLQAFVRDASREQITAWDHALPWLQDECRALEELDKTSTRYITVLEYELPRDFRRPDVIVLERGTVVVLELKGSPFPTRAALDQVRAYARDLAAYHAGCANVDVIPILVVGRAARELETRDGVMITSPVGLASLLNSLSKSNKPLIAVSDFLRADAYQPLPGIVTAARDLFHKRPLPLIKRARAATDPALHHITLIAHEAAKTKTRHLVLLSGVPGSGKTLVGLQLVHAHWLDELAASRDGVTPTAPAVYLSGNAPLVKVLQHALAEAGGGGRTFVRDIKSYVSHHSRRSNAMPLEHLLVFDEAQ